MTAQEHINKDVAELVENWGFSSVLAAISLAASEMISTQTGEPDEHLQQLHRRLNELANQAYEEGY